MLDGRTMPRANRGAAISVACLLLLALLLLLPPLWQPGSTVGSTCGCGWPGCGCLEMTLEPYNAPAPRWTPWAGVDVVPPGNPPAAQPTVTQAAPPATPAPAPTSPIPTALPVPTQAPIPTQAPFPTPEIMDQ